MHRALREYVLEVRARQFPSEEYTKYAMADEEFAEFCDYAESHPGVRRVRKGAVALEEKEL